MLGGFSNLIIFRKKKLFFQGKEVAKNLTRFHFRELIVPEASKEPLNAKLMAIRRGELIRGRTEYPTMEDVNSDWDRSESDAKLKEPPKPKEKRVKQDELVPNEKSALETNIEK